MIWTGEDGPMRVDAVSDIHRARLEEGHFPRPDGFDLEAFWQVWCENREAARPGLAVRLRVRKNALQYVRNALGERRKIFPAPAQDTDEWAVIDVAFPRFEEARLRLLALGGAVG